ncbi:hypothetical protein PI125_g8955 [Phytophthora idaei]|nr:hypothetical protein PI125_g8955 [Phytophthora idaei]
MVTNASQTRLGASLIQDQDEGELPVAFAFKVNLPTVVRYSITELECAVVI